MADEIKTLKAWMQPVNFYAGNIFETPDGVQTIPTDGNFNLGPGARLGGTLGNMNSWVWDSLVMTAPVDPDKDSKPGLVSFTCHNQQRIDLTGFLQTASALVPMGSASQRACLPQLPGRVDNKFSGLGLTNMRDFTIWSVEKLTQLDINGLYSDYITRQSTTPNMPSGEGTGGGSMSTTQMMSSQTRYYSGDQSVSGVVGWLKEIFHQVGGMGETAATPHVYCTRVIAGQFSTPSKQETGLYGPTSTKNWAASQFWISFPGSWELLNVGIIEPDELEYMTFMQRSVLAPGGRNPE